MAPVAVSARRHLSPLASPRSYYYVSCRPDDFEAVPSYYHYYIDPAMAYAALVRGGEQKGEASCEV